MKNREYPINEYPRYKNNLNLKAKGVQIGLTKEQIKEYKKCVDDPIYFIRNFVCIRTLDGGTEKFDLYDFQEDMIKIIHENRFFIGKCPRQVGKTVTTISYLLWVILFHSKQSIAILANKGGTAKGILEKVKESYENIPLWMQQGVAEWNKHNIELENGSSIIADSTSGSAGRSGTYNIVLLDEFAFVPNDMAEDFFRSVFPTISSGKSSKVLVISTPQGMNKFWELWTDAIKGRNDFIAFEIHWSNVPGRDEEWKDIQIRALGEEGFLQEHGCEFLGAANTLLPSAVIQRLEFTKPKRSVNDFNIYEEPQEGKLYLITVDSSGGVGKDYSAFSVFDINQHPYKQVCTYRNNDISPMEYPQVIYQMAQYYNNAYILVEVNAFGRQIADILYHDLEYDNMVQCKQQARKGQTISAGYSSSSALGVTTTKPIKKIGAANLKSLIEQNQLIIQDFQTISELTTYVKRRDVYGAESGKTDDLVMTLILFAWMTTQQFFREISDTDLVKKIMTDRANLYEDDMLPFPGMSNTDYPEVEMDENGDVWEKVPTKLKYYGGNSWYGYEDDYDYEN